MKRQIPRLSQLTVMVAGALTLLLGACRDDITQPLSGSRSNLDPIPDDSYTVPIPADAWNGRGTVTGTFAQFPQQTWVKITATGSLSRSPNYPGINGQVTLGPLGNSAIAIGASGIAINSSPQYAFVTGTWTTAQRYGYSEREFAGNPPGVYCGRAYNSPCDTWSGLTQITVQRLPADLALTPEFTSVAYGATPYFDYRAAPATLENGSGTPFVIDSSSWEPDNPSGADTTVRYANRGACQSQYNPACRRQLFTSGTFSMSVWVNGKRITKSVHVDVSGPTLIVSCNSVTRGSVVTCNATVSPTAAFTMNRQTASGKGFLISDSLTSSYAAGGTHTWQGIGVAKTNVRMSAKLADGRVITGQSSFDPTPRSWSAWQLTSPPDSIIGRRGRMPATLSQPGDLVMATYGLKPLTDAPAARVSAGPNRSIAYLTVRPQTPGSDVYFHKDLLPGSVFYSRQTGPRPKCTPSDMITLWAEIRRHEGITMHPDSSHWGISNIQFLAQRPEAILERIYTQRYDISPDSLDIYPVQQEAEKAFIKWNDGPHHSAQLAFDGTDYPVIFATKLQGCNFDRRP